MSSQQLLDPIIEGGIHSTNFFNGRRLTAEDLVREKKANRQHERLLGQAIGEGVVYGLDVGLPGRQVTGGTTLEIQKGLAINRNGDALYLPDTIKLSLVPPSEEEKIIKADFTDCKVVYPKEYPSNTGIYVLLIRPATDLSGSAPMSSIPDGGSIIGCGKSDLVEGVQFRVVKMDLKGPAFGGLNESTKTKLLEVSAKTDDESVSMFKNIVAHACFGTQEIKKIIEDPFGGNDFSYYGAIDRLRSLDEDSKYKITEFDVPLSILRWTQEKIQFVDMWSVRRRQYELIPSAKWPTLVSPRRMAEAEAMFFQFQEHVESLIQPGITQSALRSIKAEDYFHYLPPVGVLPLTTAQWPRGFDYLKLFLNLTYRDPVFIEGAKVDPLIRDSLACPPIDPAKKELIWLYTVRENIELIARKTKSLPQPYMIFTSGYIPYQGNARFNLARWDYGNYSSV